MSSRVNVLAIKAKISQVAETKNWLPLFSSNVWQNALTESNQRPSTTIKDHQRPSCPSCSLLMEFRAKLQGEDIVDKPWADNVDW